MNAWSLMYSNGIKPLSFFMLLPILIGCGAVGAPIPPEEVGIAAKVRKQQQHRASSEKAILEDGTESVEKETVELPAFYPIGTR